MKYVGVDLHKNSISICVVVLVGRKRKVVARKRFACQDVAGISRFFRELGRFQVVVEATASYQWFVALVEGMADRVVLAPPKKLRIIAQSKYKTDKIDAWILAEFLALDMIPEAYRPTPRQREGPSTRWRWRRRSDKKSPGPPREARGGRPRRTLDLVIPRRVAPQQSPTPFDQAREL